MGVVEEGTVKKVTTVYDAPQHCRTVRAADGKGVSMDCPYTGKGEELSPGHLVEAALGGCMLLSMGTLAMHDGLDITGARIEVQMSATVGPVMRYQAIDITVTMPRNFSDKDRTRLERAAEGCPIKHAFSPEIPISVRYQYPA